MELLSLRQKNGRHVFHTENLTAYENTQKQLAKYKELRKAGKQLPDNFAYALGVKLFKRRRWSSL